ncbi:MAG: CdaR family protein [candidate division WOR-3 bacterium]
MNIIKFIFEDFVLKIFSLLIAAILWFHSATEKTYVAERDVILEYEEVPSDITFREVPIKKIKVYFEGKGKDLLKLYFSKPKVYLNLKEVKEGKNVLSIKESDIKISGDIKVNKIILNQKFINLNLEKKGNKRVKVKIEHTGKPREGYDILKIVPEEKEVVITGPKSVVEKIDEVKCKELDISGKKFSFYDYLQILPPSTLVNVSPSSLRVYVEIEERKFKEIEKEIIIITSEEYDTDIEPKKIKIKFSGAKTRIEDLDPEKITVIINLTGFGEGEYYIPPKIFYPEEINIEELSPSFVRVILRKRI